MSRRCSNSSQFCIAMRVLHFCGAFSRLSQTFIYDLITGLEKQGLDNHVVTFERLREDSRPFDKVHVVRAARRNEPESLVRRAAARLGASEGAAACWPMEQRRIASVIERVQPDVIHAHFGMAGAKIEAVARKMNIPLVTTFHGFDATNLPNNPFWKRQYQELWQTSRAVVGVSENICNKLRELGAPKEKVARIANGVKIEDFPYQCPTDRFDGRRVEWLFVGRLVEKKGPLLLLESFRLALEKLPADIEASLHIVGDGEEMPALLGARERHGLESSVHVHGAQPHTFVRSMMRRCHLTAQHSVTAADGNQEGQPVGLIEAAASGMPLVATRHSGIPEIVVDGRNGFLVEERDVEEMGGRMAFLSSNPGFWPEMSRWGREHVERNLQLGNQVKVWERLYHRIRHGAAVNEQEVAEVVQAGGVPVEERVR